MSKIYIAVLDAVPSHMVPVLVAHSMLGAHMVFAGNEDYDRWLYNSYSKCVVKVNNKEFLKIRGLSNVYLGHENTVLEGCKTCAVVIPSKGGEVPNVLKFAKLWNPD